MSKPGGLSFLLSSSRCFRCAISRQRQQHSDAKTAVTIDNVFSDWNRERIQKAKKLSSVEDVWKADHSKLEGKIDTREAAVLVPFCHVNGEPSILFMQRSIHLNSHAGEICFPGGMRDETDHDSIFTALRETHEEIGLPTENVTVWGCLPPTPSNSTGRFATPVVGYCGEIDIDQLTLNHTEVELVFTRTVASLCDPANIRQTQFRSQWKATPKGYTMPVYLAGEFRIWGLSAIILHQVLGAIAPGLYKFRVRHRS